MPHKAHVEKDDTVPVLNFCVFDAAASAMRLSRYKALSATIKAKVGGETLEGICKDVSGADLNEFGRYLRLATG